MPWRRIIPTTGIGFARSSRQTRTQLDFSPANLLHEIRHQQSRREDERDQDARAEIALNGEQLDSNHRSLRRFCTQRRCLMAEEPRYVDISEELLSQMG